MRTRNQFSLLFVTVLILLFTSCGDDDGHSLGKFVGRIATVKIESGASYILTDDNKTLTPIAGYFPWTQLLDGDRIAINYTVLYDDFYGYDEAIKVNSYYPVLTKPVEVLNTEEENLAFGDDVVWILDLWVGGGYLNVMYGCPVPISTPHRISLVENKLNLESSEGEDDYIHLEYRYNANGDIAETGEQNLIRSFVSFNLNSVTIPEGCKGFKIRINSAKNGIKTLTYELGDSNDQKGVNLLQQREVIDSSIAYSTL